MKKLILASLVLTSLASALPASANIAAAINKRTGAMHYAVANMKMNKLAAAAMKMCDDAATMSNQCVAVTNAIGKCENPKATKAFYGRLAYDYTENGYVGWLTCAIDQAKADQYVYAACSENCKFADSVFDDGQ